MLLYFLKAILIKWVNLGKDIIKRRDVRSNTMLKYMIKGVEIASKKHIHTHNF
jgi:hypothetical protein